MVISINKKVADLGAIPVTIQECSKHFFSKEFLKTEQIASISGRFSKMNSQRILRYWKVASKIIIVGIYFFKVYNGNTRLM